MEEDEGEERGDAGEADTDSESERNKEDNKSGGGTLISPSTNEQNDLEVWRRHLKCSSLVIN